MPDEKASQDCLPRTQDTNASALNVGVAHAARWLVPFLYAFCAACFLLDFWENHRRIILAEEISSIVRRDRPTTLDELKVSLADVMASIDVRQVPSEFPELNGARIELTPRLWLHLWVHLKPESDEIEDISLVYASSEEVPFDRIREKLGSQTPWFTWALSITFIVCPAWLWLRVSRRLTLESVWEIVCATVAVLPLLGLLPLAAITLLRVSF